MERLAGQVVGEGQVGAVWAVGEAACAIGLPARLMSAEFVVRVWILLEIRGVNALDVIVVHPEDLEERGGARRSEPKRIRGDLGRFGGHARGERTTGRRP